MPDRSAPYGRRPPVLRAVFHPGEPGRRDGKFDAARPGGYNDASMAPDGIPVRSRRRDARALAVDGVIVDSLSLLLL